MKAFQLCISKKHKSQLIFRMIEILDLNEKINRYLYQLIFIIYKRSTIYYQPHYCKLWCYIVVDNIYNYSI